MLAYLKKVIKELKKFAYYDIFQVPRAENSNANALAHLATSKDFEILKTVPFEVLEQPTIQGENEKEVMPIEMMTVWMLPIYKFLVDGKLPKDRVKAKNLSNRSTRHIIYEKTLYHRGYSTPLLHCLNGEESGRVLKEIHEGICDNHTGGHFLAYKILR